MIEEVEKDYNGVIAIMKTLGINEIEIEEKNFYILPNEYIYITRDVKNNKIKIILRVGDDKDYGKK